VSGKCPCERTGEERVISVVLNTFLRRYRKILRAKNQSKSNFINANLPKSRSSRRESMLKEKSEGLRAETRGTAGEFNFV